MQKLVPNHTMTREFSLFCLRFSKSSAQTAGTKEAGGKEEGNWGQEKEPGPLCGSLVEPSCNMRFSTGTTTKSFSPFLAINLKFF